MTDLDGNIMADKGGYTVEHPNILNYLLTDHDQDLMVDAMKKAELGYAVDSRDHKI